MNTSINNTFIIYSNTILFIYKANRTILNPLPENNTIYLVYIIKFK